MTDDFTRRAERAAYMKAYRHGYRIRPPREPKPKPQPVRRKPPQRVAADWQDRAACASPDVSVDWFFPVGSTNYGKALAICARCPVRIPCLEHALANNETHGVYGGTTPRDRQNIRRNREPRNSA